MITENGYLILCIVAYALLFFGIFGRGKNKQAAQMKILALMLSFLFLWTTAVLSTPANNQIIGLLNLALGMLAAGLTVYYATTVMPNV